MKNCNVVDLTLNKFNEYCVYFSENYQIRKLIGQKVKFVDFTLKNSNKFKTSENSEKNDSINNILILLCLHQQKDERDREIKTICEISLNLKENTSQINKMDDNFMGIQKESYIKIEQSNYDDDDKTEIKNVKHILNEENEYVLKITYEYEKNPNYKCNNNINNIQKSSIIHSQFDLYDEEEDEEDEDYVEDEEESEIENESRDESQISENEDFIASNNNKIGDEFDQVEEIFLEADDINRDLLYLTDEEINSESYNHLIEQHESDNCHGERNSNQKNNLNLGNKRYLLRRKRGPTNY